MRLEEADARGILPVWYCWSMLGRGREVGSLRAGPPYPTDTAHKSLVLCFYTTAQGGGARLLLAKKEEGVALTPSLCIRAEEDEN